MLTDDWLQVNDEHILLRFTGVFILTQAVFTFNTTNWKLIFFTSAVTATNVVFATIFTIATIIAFTVSTAVATIASTTIQSLLVYSHSAF